MPTHWHEHFYENLALGIALIPFIVMGLLLVASALEEPLREHLWKKSAALPQLRKTHR